MSTIVATENAKNAYLMYTKVFGFVCDLHVSNVALITSTIGCPRNDLRAFFPNHD